MYNIINLSLNDQNYYAGPLPVHEVYNEPSTMIQLKPVTAQHPWTETEVDIVQGPCAVASQQCSDT